MPILSRHHVGEDPVDLFNSNQDEDKDGDQDRTTNNQKASKAVITSFVFKRIC